MIKRFKKGEVKGHYSVEGYVTEDDIIGMAKKLIGRRFNRGRSLTSPHETRHYLSLILSDLEHETFATIFLDNRHRVLAFEEMFKGTIDGASVHPREVVKRALRLNAAAVIFVHNHPSGVAEPSQADRNITQKLKNALALVEIRVLDHIVVGGTDTVSMAESGML